MLKFWEERKKDVKAHNARRAQELAAKHFRMCPVKFAETMFPEVKLLPFQKKCLCQFYSMPSQAKAVMFSGRLAGKRTLYKMAAAADTGMILHMGSAV